MNGRKKLVITGILFFIFLSLYVIADQQTATMTWVVPSAKSHSVAYGGSCSSIAFFFPEDQATLDSDIDGNAAMILPQQDRVGTAACQASDTAGMTIKNTGTSSINIDANFSAAGDANTWLKVWSGTGSGCGTNGMGGWEFLCSQTGNTAGPVFTTGCKDFNTGNATTATTLIASLGNGDSNQLCFSGEFRADIGDWLYPADVSAGDYNRTWQTSTDVT